MNLILSTNAALEQANSESIKERAAATTSRLLSTHPGSYEHGTFGDQLGDDLPVQVPENGADLIKH